MEILNRKSYLITQHFKYKHRNSKFHFKNALENIDKVLLKAKTNVNMRLKLKAYLKYKKNFLSSLQKNK